MHKYTRECYIGLLCICLGVSSGVDAQHSAADSTHVSQVTNSAVGTLDNGLVQQEVVNEDSYLRIVGAATKNEGIPPEAQQRLVANAERIIHASFAKAGTQNNTQRKLAVFRATYPTQVSLLRNGIDLNVAFIPVEKEAYLTKAQDRYVTVFMSRIPPSTEQVERLQKQIDLLEKRYVEEIKKRYPEFTHIAGDDSVAEEVSTNVRQIRADVVDIATLRGILIAPENIQAQIEGRLPDVKTLSPNAGKAWLEKLHDATIPDSARQVAELQYRLSVAQEIDRTLRGFTQALYATTDETEVAAKIMPFVVGLSKDDLDRLAEQRNTALSEMLRKARELPPKKE